MRVVSFIGFTPPPRFDEKTWTHVRVDGSAESTGPWAEIETIALDPLDDNPAEPLERDFTTELASDEAWFRAVFLDEDGDESETEPVPLRVVAFRPSLNDVGALIRSYTRSDTTGAATGTFDDETNPTGRQVDEYLEHAVAEVAFRLPADLDDDLDPFVKRLVAIRAALFVIIALQSDQDTSEDSAYGRLKTLYDEGWAALEAKLKQTTSSGVRVASVTLESPFSGPIETIDPADPDA